MENAATALEAKIRMGLFDLLDRASPFRCETTEAIRQSSPMTINIDRMNFIAFPHTIQWNCSKRVAVHCTQPIDCIAIMT